jgi:hypothetical protein
MKCPRSLRPATLTMASAVLAFACGGAPDASPGSGAAPGSAAGSGGLVGPEVVSRCAGFGPAEAAGFLGVPAAAIVDRSSDITPTARICAFAVAADESKAVSFTLERDESVEASARAYASMKDMIPIAAGAQQSTDMATGDSPLIEIGGLGDEALWTNTNHSLTVRSRNLTILVMLPNERPSQIKVADKVLELLKTR